MDSPKFQFILFDLIGTTVQDTGNGGSLVVESFRKAFLSNGVHLDDLEINPERGKSKKEAIARIAGRLRQPPALADKVYADFMSSLDSAVSRFTEMEGASEVFKILKGGGVKLGLGSGLPMHLITRVVEVVGWHPDCFDYIGSSEILGRSRPDPVMINDALRVLKIDNKTKVLKVGDTVADIQEGKNAGVGTAAVLSGTQPAEVLEKANPDFLFSNIREIIPVL